ncbi:sigma-70 family RNA polymerase sigma factor [Clostridium neuense]|uniref:Sigma-70 family RNA polymerase sigma factor n=1 Tax=Clostridium neuense TaxID=1728934 RepID=A0ABW8TI57_9CLOT
MKENIIEFDKLCKEAKNGDGDAVWLIIEKLKPFIIKCSHSIYLKNYALEDIISVANIALLKSIKCFKLDSGKHFFPYAIITIKNELNMEIRKVAKCWMESSLNNYLEVSGENSGIFSSENSLEEDYIVKELIEARLKILSDEERKLIVSVFYKGVTLMEYSKFNNLSYKKCSNMKLKAMRKMKKVK